MHLRCRPHPLPLVLAPHQLLSHAHPSATSVTVTLHLEPIVLVTHHRSHPFLLRHKHLPPPFLPPRTDLSRPPIPLPIPPNLPPAHQHIRHPLCSHALHIAFDQHIVHPSVHPNPLLLPAPFPIIPPIPAVPFTVHTSLIPAPSRPHITLLAFPLRPSQTAVLATSQSGGPRAAHRLHRPTPLTAIGTGRPAQPPPKKLAALRHPEGGRGQYQCLAGTEKELARKYVQFYRAHPLAALQKPAVLPSLVAVPARTPLAARVVDSGLEGRGARGAETTGG